MVQYSLCGSVAAGSLLDGGVDARKTPAGSVGQCSAIIDLLLKPWKENRREARTSPGARGTTWTDGSTSQGIQGQLQLLGTAVDPLQGAVSRCLGNADSVQQLIEILHRG